MSVIRRQYTAKEKLKVIDFAVSEGNSKAARHFMIPESNIRLWRKKKMTIERMPKMKKANRDQHALLPDLEKALMNWITERRLGVVGVSCVEIRIKAMELKKKSSIPVPLTFEASYGWGRRFMERNNLSVRRRTTIAQKLPPDHEHKLQEFQKFVICLRKKNGYDLSQIRNADQTPLNFDMPYQRTVDMKGVNSVTLRTTGHDRSHFTVMLGCTADGGKLAPYIIFKRKLFQKI